MKILIIIIILLLTVVPDTTVKKKVEKEIKVAPPKSEVAPQPKSKMGYINKKQRVELTKMDSLLKVKDSLNKIKK